jgi:hypothetical protein
MTIIMPPGRRRAFAVLCGVLLIDGDYGDNRVEHAPPVCLCRNHFVPLTRGLTVNAPMWVKRCPSLTGSARQSATREQEP